MSAPARRLLAFLIAVALAAAGAPHGRAHGLVVEICGAGGKMRLAPANPVAPAAAHDCGWCLQPGLEPPAAPVAPAPRRAAHPAPATAAAAAPAVETPARARDPPGRAPCA